MENVVAFNNELSGLYESKPPISKAKMAAITRAAMRAIKFYKHVVQSVEKFILKCKPEYKVPGLYVIDSIVRQSRHQFGAEKDVFAPRFARNMKETFANLFRCAPEDKSRIIRVLNLWQKNNVFAPDVIQPIFDLADPNHPIYSMPPPGAAAASSAGPSGSGNLSLGDMSATSQANGGLNTSGGSLDISMGGGVGSVGSQADDKLPPSGLADLSNNNLKQLLNDPNVLRQLQTLQNFTKFKQDDKQHNLRLQEEAFEKHLQNVLKNSASSSSGNQDANDFNKEVEFVSEEQKIEVINLDGNDSRSPTPDRDRYKRRRSRSRSRSRDRGGRNRRGRSRSRSRSRSPRSSNRRRNSRDRERTNRDKEKDREHERERRKKGLPEIKKDHLSVCSTTLWVGHLSKLVYQEELSDTFGEYGDIVSIDQIVPRGCAFIVMNRRQDAHKAMQCLKNHKLQGRAITISWAAGKGVKSKEWKDFWDLELGVTYIPWNKLDESTDFDALEEGGMFDEDSMPSWMKEKINKLKSLKEGGVGGEHASLATAAAGLSGPPPVLPPGGNPAMMFGIDTTQPPPGPPPTGGPPPMIPMVPGQFSMAPPMGGPPRMLGPPHMGMPISGLHMPPNIVPPHAMMMMSGFGMAGPGGAPPLGPPHMPPMAGPHPTQFPPPPGGPPASAMASNLSSDDQMDIEMEDEEGATVASANPPAAAGSGNSGINFSQPPPAFAGGSGENPANAAGEPFSRERNRGGAAGSRWGGRGGGAGGPDDEVNEGRWRENGGGPHNFGDSGPRNAGGLPHRPDFMNDFDKRGGPGGPRGGGGGGGPNFNGGGGDFHPNMQNRFNQPTNLMQMRIPPPNAFNQRGGPGGGGPPMFMRGGQGGPGGGGRQQGPGFFNRNNPFDRDINEGFGGRGRGRGGGGGGRGGGRGGRGGGGFGGGRDGGMPGSGGPHGGNWSDEEGGGDDGGFKRRGGGGMGGGNRFRDREGSADRFNMRDNNNRGGRRGPGGGGPARDRNDSERDTRAGRGPSAGSSSGGGGGGRRMSKDENNKKKARICDTEEDWDRELEEYDAKTDKKQTTEQPAKTSENTSSIAKNAGDNASKNTDAGKMEKPAALQANDKKPETKEVKEDNEPKAASKPEMVNTPAATTTTSDDSDKNAKSATPLYDELPAPKSNANSTNKPANVTTTAGANDETVKPTPPTAKETAKPPANVAEKPAEVKAIEQKPAATNETNNTTTNTNKAIETVTPASSNEAAVTADSKTETNAAESAPSEA